MTDTDIKAEAEKLIVKAESYQFRSDGEAWLIMSFQENTKNLLAHIEQLEKERDEAYQQGRESMREEAAVVAEANDMKLRIPTYKVDIAKAIREIE